MVDGILGSYAQRIERLVAQSRFREPDDGRLRAETEQRAEEAGVPFVDVSSNDYLGMARGRNGPEGRHERGKGAEAEWGEEEVSRETSGGSGASRLLAGTHPAHQNLERELADWLGYESALVFSSGYAANVGALSALLEPTDHVYSDALNHASLIDGCRLARACIHVFPHGNVEALQRQMDAQTGAGRIWIVSESLFSMDGDPAPLPALADLARRARAGLFVDEAHALGIIGPKGAGLCRELGIHPTAVVGTFGKALGTQGAFIALPPILRTWLWNRARAFVYSTAPSPMLMALTRHRLHQVQNAERLRTELRAVADAARAAFVAAGIPTVPAARGPIIPLLVGSSDRALALAERLRGEGILAFAIRPPTVPPGSARLRITVHAGLGSEELQHLLSTVPRIWWEQ